MIRDFMTKGLLQELNPGPLAPEARSTPLDQAADDFKVNPTLLRALLKKAHALTYHFRPQQNSTP